MRREPSDPRVLADADLILHLRSHRLVIPFMLSVGGVSEAALRASFLSQRTDR